MLPSKQEIVDKALSEVNFEAWENLHREYADKIAAQRDVWPQDRIEKLERNYSKYFELEKWLQYHSRHVMTADLHDGEGPKRILDLGCGAGIFLFICRTLGHHGVGLDIDSGMYRRMAEILGVDWRASPVLANTPLPEEFQGLDLISAIAIKFDRLDYGPQSAEPWGLDEWQYFLRDAASRLNPGGHIFIKPNYLIHPTETDPGVFFKDGRIMDLMRDTSVKATEHFDFLIPKSAFA
jgi:SAM-dependent methyltransferase